ncbi:MAG: FKBP-type peptidyl-prolyl cis-trans isomerase [Planctomycetota bacterium]
MPRTVFSPHSGLPVKVRDQDLGRALRDEAGRIFYVVERPDQPGVVYGAKTRKGSPAELERYDALAESPDPAGIATEPDTAADRASSPTATTPRVAHASAPVHDATGGRRARSTGRRKALLILAMLLGAAAAYALFGPLPDDAWRDKLPWNTPQESTPAEPVPAPPDHPAPRTPASLVDPILPIQSPGVAWRPVQHAVGPSPAQDDWPGWEVVGDLRRLTVDRRPDAEALRPDGFVRYRMRVLTPGGRAIESLSDPAERLGVLSKWTMPDALRAGLTGMRLGERRLVAVPRDRWPIDWRRAAGRSSAKALLVELTVTGLRPGVAVETLIGGQGPTVRPGDHVEVHWIAFVGPSARPLDSTRQRGAAQRLTVGAGEVIPGLEHGLIGMRTGETRRVRVPPALAFGEQGLPPMVPPGATLTYQVRLVALIPGEPAPATAVGSGATPPSRAVRPIEPGSL